MKQDQFLLEYDKLEPRLRDILKSLETRIKSEIDKRNLKIHAVEIRLKTPTSLRQKLSRPDRTYETLWQITDILAIRVITYSEDVISLVARAIEDSFEIDLENSVNKLKSVDQQRFGYRSLHYVCIVPDSVAVSHTGLPKRLKFEVQVRTNLQHTWAEFEHDLGYKTTGELPGPLRRRFSQIASLLEVADREFVAVRTEIENYQRELALLDLTISDHIELDQFSYPRLLEHPEIIELDQRVSTLLGRPSAGEMFYPEYLLRALRAAGLNQAKSVLEALTANTKAIDSFVDAYFAFSRAQWNLERSSVTEIKKGYGLLFLAHLVILGRDALVIDQLQSLTEFYQAIDYPNDRENAKSVAKALIAALKESAHA